MTYPIAGYNSYMNYGHYQFNNTVAARNVTFTSQPDMVSLSTNNQVQDKKTGLSKNAKLGLGTLALVGIGTAAYILSRGKVGSKSAKQLAEYVEFKPAKTVQEATKFAKEKLGVHYNGIEDVEVVNFVNEWLTGVHNSSKIKDFKAYPKFVSTDYNILDGNTLFGIIDEVIKREGQQGYLLTINLNNLKNIPKLLTEIKTNPHGIWQVNSAGQICLKGEKYNTAEINELVNKINNYDVSTASLKYSMDLYEQVMGLVTSPIGPDGKVVLKKLSMFNCLNHEHGHMKHYINGVHPADMDKIAVYRRLNKDIPTVVKDFHKPEVKQIAAKVSRYATESPLEFVAETYAQLKDGVVFSNDVMELYKKYCGPALS